MARNITVVFDDGTSHVYQNAPDDITPDSVIQRAQKEFGKSIVSLDGGRKPKPAMSSAEVPIMSDQELANYKLRRAQEPVEPQDPGLGGRIKDAAADWGMGSGDVVTGLGQLLSVPETAANEAIAKVSSLATGKNYQPAQPIVANALRDTGGETTDYYADQKSDYSNARAQDIQNAEGFTGKVKAYIDNPSQILSGAIRSLPSFVGPAAATRAVAAENAAKTAIAAGGVVEGAASGGETYHNVMDMTFDELVEGSPDFNALLKQDIPPSEAKLILANKAGISAQAMQTPLSILASKAFGTGQIDAEFFTDPMAKTFKEVMKELPGNTARQGAEEMAQEVTGQSAVNIAEQGYADKNKSLTEGIDDAAAGGLMLGASQAAGMSGVNAAFSGINSPQVNAPADVDMPMNGEEIGGFDDAQTNQTLNLEHNPQRMIVMPDGTTAWESETADLRQNTDSKIAAQHPGYAKINESPEAIEAQLGQPLSVDDELSQLMAEIDSYKATGLQKASASIAVGNSPPLQNVQGDFLDGSAADGLFDGVRQQQAEQARLQREQEAKRNEFAQANFVEDDERGFMGEVQRLIEQAQFEPADNKTNDPSEVNSYLESSQPEEPLSSDVEKSPQDLPINSDTTQPSSTTKKSKSAQNHLSDQEANDYAKATDSPVQNIHFTANMLAATGKDVKQYFNDWVANKPKIDQERQQKKEEFAKKVGDDLADKFYNTPGIGKPIEISEIDAAANEAATSPMNDLPEPTEAQKEAGNYKKAKIKLHGLDISIENPKGSTRSGIDPDGKEWESEMHSHYGYIRGTKSRDDEQVDVFIGPNPESQKVYVVDQLNKDGSFDEVKVMMGYDSPLRAKAGYSKNYSKGWKVGPITSMSIDEFKDWLKTGDTKKPLALNQNQEPIKKPKPEITKSASNSPAKNQEPIKKPANNLHPILTKTKNLYVKQMAVAKGLKRGSPGYDNAFKKLEDEYETELDKAHASLPFEQYNELNSGTPESINRQAHDALREEFGIREETKPIAKISKLAERVESRSKKASAKTENVNDDLKKPSATDTAQANQSPINSEKIDDVGDQLVWNKKGMFKGGGLKWDDIKDENATLKVKMAAKNKVWAKPDWEALVSTVPDDQRKGFAVVAHLVKQVYDAIPTKPARSTDEDIQAYIQAVTDVRIAAESLLNNKENQAAVFGALAGKSWRQAQTTIDVHQLGNVKTEALNQLLDSAFPAINGNRWAKGTAEYKRAQMIGSKAISAMQFNMSSAVKALKAVEKDGWPASQEAWQRQGFTIQENGDNEFELKKRRLLIGTYATEAEAIDAARAQVSRKKNGETETTEAEESWWVRVGDERRENNRNVTPEELRDAFGFRGVNFGKWLNQSDRQQHINAAFDALHDLAAVLNIPPKAIGLGGKVGLAFGAQGGGSAAAHFVPGVNEINITKTSGAGSLAHEWGHAFDHYFGVQAGLERSSNPFASHIGYKIDGSVRPEIAEAFKAIVDVMHNKQQTMLEAITAHNKAVQAEQERFDINVSRLKIKEKIAGNKAAEDAFAEVEKGNAGDYVNLPSKARSKWNIPSIPQNIKTVFDAMGMDAKSMHQNYIYLMRHFLNQKESDIELRKIHTDFYKRSSKKESSGKPYWTTKHEMFARAFESYVMDKIAEGTESKNNYLVRENKSESFAEGNDRFAYPAGEERATINDAFEKLIAELRVQNEETDNPMLYSLFAGGLDSGRDGVAFKKAGSGAAVSAKDADEVVARIRREIRGNVDITVADDFTGFPRAVQDYAAKNGDKGEDIKGVFHNGSIIINRAAADDIADLERTVLHELYGHYGLKKLFGEDIRKAMATLYFAIGGTKGIKDLSAKHGINLKAYEKSLEKQPIEVYLSVMTEELLAHIAQDNKPGIVRRVKELVGALRNWLRKKGFLTLSNVSDTEIHHLLKQAREAAQKSPGAVKGDDVMLSLKGIPEITRKVIGSDPLLAAWTVLAQDDGAFQLPTSSKKNIEDIFSEQLPGVPFVRAPQFDDDGAKVWKLNPDKYTMALVFQKGKSVWIDVSDIETGQGGRRIYNAVANYAYNNDLVFVGDPAGLSDIALTRRLENMISSALKFGTTKHLWPHDRQREGKASIGVPGIKWKSGDDAFNLKEMITASYQATKNQFPEIENLRYDPSIDEIRRIDNGEIYPASEIEKITQGKRLEGVQSKSTITAGRKTLERAVFTNTILRGTRQEQFNVLAGLSKQRSQRLASVLYSLKPDEKSKPETRSGGFSFGQSKNRGATLPHQLREAYGQLGGADKTFFDKVKTQVKRQLAPRGLLPKEIFDLKIARDGEMNANDSQQRFILADFYAQIQEVYHKPYQELNKHTRKEINDYLKGERMNVKLTKSMVQVLARMRAHIQSLSNSYIDELLLDAANLESEGKTSEAQEKRNLIETIIGNYDTYLHRSYRAFDDPDWPKKVPEDVYRAAVDYLAKQYDGDVKAAAKKIDLMLHEGTAYDSLGRFISESKLGSKDLSVLKTRKQIAPEIRALLGEYEDPAINYAKSASKMTRLVSNTSFLRQMKNTAVDLGLLFDEENRPLGAHKKIAGDASEVYAPLNGMYTYPEFAQALHDAVGSNQEPDWYKALVAANASVKYGKTVLAPTTAVRNFLSASMFALTSGHWDVTKLEKSVKSVKTYFTGQDVRGSREYINKLLKLGVLYDAPNYRELQDLIKSVNESEHWLAKATRKSKVGAVLNYAQEFYALGDDFWKIMGFENEKAMLIKHHKMSEADAEKEAAERIRNTYPTYSLTGKGIQTLRRFPVVGSFPSFPAEIIRTTYHKFRYFHQDAKELGYDNPAVIAKGVGLALGAGMMAGISALSAAMLGIDDDEEEAIRQMLPEWSRNSALLFLGRDEKRQMQYMDLGWLDPYAYWKKPLSALARDGDVTDRAADSIWEALSPFVGLDIAAGEMVELFDNIRDPGITAEKTATDVAKGLAPGFVGNVLGFWNAADQTITKSGKEYNFEDEALALIGFRKGTLNAKVGLTYQAYGYLERKRAAAKTLRDVATNMSDISIDDLRDAYERSMKMHREAWDDMRRTVKIAEKAGLTKDEAVAALRTSGVSRHDAGAIVDDQEFVYKPSKNMMKLAIRRSAILFDEETAAQMQERAKQMQELQQKYMEKPVR